MANVITADKLQQLDVKLFRKLHKQINVRAKVASVYLSKSGDGHFYFALSLLIALFEPKQGVNFFIAALIGFCIEVPTYLLLKNLFKRNRPFDAITEFSSFIAPSDKFSMPSGHTAAAFVFCGMILAFYPAFFPLAIVWASLIGLSRVVLGVHFPGDIIAGVLLGIVSCELALTIVNTVSY